MKQASPNPSTGSLARAESTISPAVNSSRAAARWPPLRPWPAWRIPRVHAAEDNTIRLALIGCGGRGSGAVGRRLRLRPAGRSSWSPWPTSSRTGWTARYKVLSEKFGDRVDVPPDRRFVGFDAYRKAIDCLRPGDVAMLTGYAGFRPVQLEYAVEKGVNVFMEKSFAADRAGAAAGDQGRRGGGEEEPQDRRRPACAATRATARS